MCLLCCEATGVAGGVDSGHSLRTIESVEEAQMEFKSLVDDTFAHEDQRWLAHDIFAHGDQRLLAHDEDMPSRPFDIRQDVILSRCIDSLCKTVDGRYMSWPTIPSDPVGDYPLNWCDGLHNEDGQGLRHSARDQTGEQVLSRELAALYIREGIEYATDDVSNA